MEELLRSFGLRTDDDWMEALKLPPRIRHHVRAAKENGESLTQRPRITCSTIHGVKGGEADNVFLRADVSQSSFQSLMRDISNESRVFFVGASRAKHNLYIQTPRTPRYFDMNGALA